MPRGKVRPIVRGISGKGFEAGIAGLIPTSPACFRGEEFGWFCGCHLYFSSGVSLEQFKSTSKPPATIGPAPRDGTVMKEEKKKNAGFVLQKPHSRCRFMSVCVCSYPYHMPWRCCRGHLKGHACRIRINGSRLWLPDQTAFQGLGQCFTYPLGPHRCALRTTRVLDHVHVYQRWVELKWNIPDHIGVMRGAGC
jgi:hypothetical protein